MATTPTQVRIDADIKREAAALFACLGLDMSGAVNLFLHQCVLRGGLPFAVEIPQYRDKTLSAMAEAQRISHDTDVKGYNSMEEINALAIPDEERQSLLERIDEELAVK